MTKEEMLRIMRLLSALESWSFSSGKPIVDYLLDEISTAIETLEREILK